MPESKRRQPKGAPRRRTPGTPKATSQRTASQRLEDALLADFCQQNQRCTVTFDWRGQPHTITYRPTPRMIREAARFQDQQSGRWPALARLLTECVVEWDLTENRQSLPITVESIMGLVADLPLAMARAIDRDCTERLEAYKQQVESELAAIVATVEADQTGRE